jgi:hypothetical protein
MFGNYHNSCGEHIEVYRNDMKVQKKTLKFQSSTDPKLLEKVEILTKHLRFLKKFEIYMCQVTSIFSLSYEKSLKGMHLNIERDREISEFY